MTRRSLLLFFGLAACLDAQDAAALRGAYRFVHLSYSDGAKFDAVSAGGTVSFDGAGVAQWGDSNARYEITGPLEATLTANGTQLALHFSQDGGVLVGSAAGASGARHHLLIAIRAAEGVPPMAFRGNYGLASLAIRGADAAGLATAFSQITASGMGQFTRAILAGHAAGVDDVNRREERTGLTYELGSDGTGIAHWGSGSDVLSGDTNIVVSTDGAILLGWSADAANPAILVGLRKSPEAAVFSFQGRFWLAEAMAENSFVFQQSTKPSSAWGVLASNRAGLAFVSQRILSDGETRYLATANRYRVGSDGANMLGPKLEAGVDNFAFNDAAFISAQTGALGQLTLGHGIAFGLAAPPALPTLASAASPLTPDAPIVPGALMWLSGNFGDAAAMQVRINGAEAQLNAATSERISFQAPPFSDGPVVVEVLSGGKVIHTLPSHRAASAPTAFTAEGVGIGVLSAKAAEPGETVEITVTGLGAAPTLRVSFDGHPGEVLSALAIDGQPGRYRVSVVVPRDIDVAAGSTREVPVALVTPDSFSDLADLLVTRR